MRPNNCYGATDLEGACLNCRLWGRLSLQVREEFGKFLGIGRKPPYLCIVNQNKQHLSDKERDSMFNNLKY
jgi:hypothetical protein